MVRAFCPDGGFVGKNCLFFALRRTFVTFVTVSQGGWGGWGGGGGKTIDDCGLRIGWPNLNHQSSIFHLSMFFVLDNFLRKDIAGRLEAEIF
jgi:hypothetical protein